MPAISNLPALHFPGAAASPVMPPAFPVQIDLPTLLAIAVLVLLAAAACFSEALRSWLSRIQRKRLFTANEVEFLHRLQRALPAYYVFPQVSFAALLTDDEKLSG